MSPSRQVLVFWSNNDRIQRPRPSVRDGTAPVLLAVLTPGTHVEVRARFEGRWVAGFEVVSRHDELYAVRRQLDGVVLPAGFKRADLRRRT